MRRRRHTPFCTQITALLHRQDAINVPDSLSPASHQFWGQAASPVGGRSSMPSVAMWGRKFQGTMIKFQGNPKSQGPKAGCQGLIRNRMGQFRATGLPPRLAGYWSLEVGVSLRLEPWDLVLCRPPPHETHHTNRSTVAALCGSTWPSSSATLPAEMPGLCQPWGASGK